MGLYINLRLGLRNIMTDPAHRCLVAEKQWTEAIAHRIRLP